MLVLWADDASSNLGLRAIGAGTRALVQRAWPEAEVVFHNFGAPRTPVRVGSVRSAMKEQVTGRGGLIPWLRGFDLVLDTRSGDSFSDIYGLRRLTTMSLMAVAVSRAAVPLVMTPQTVGPFTSPTGRIMARGALRGASSVMVRDSQSAQASAALGRRADLVATDVVFALPMPEPAPSRDILLNVSGLLWADNPHVPSEDYRRTIRTLIRRLTDLGREVTFLAHVLDSASADNDIVAIRDLRREFPGHAAVVPSNLADVRSAVAASRLTVGSRMHACLNSLSVGTPAIPLAYSRKFVPLMLDIGWDSSVDLRHSTDPVGEVLAMASEEELLMDRARDSRAQAHALLGPVVAALRAVR